MFGYDWPRFHAAVNDLPTALLLVSVLFDLVGVIRKREDLRTVGFWTLMVGVVGTGAAVVAGLKAAGAAQHSDEAHAVMEQHQTMGLILLGIFAALALWRLARRRVQSPAEQTVASVVGLIGLAVMIRTAQLGGSLMFEHALGIPSTRLHTIEGQRESEEHEHGGEPMSHRMTRPDSVAHARSDSAKHSRD